MRPGSSRTRFLARPAAGIFESCGLKLGKEATRRSARTYLNLVACNRSWKLSDLLEAIWTRLLEPGDLKQVKEHREVLMGPAGSHFYQDGLQ